MANNRFSSPPEPHLFNSQVWKIVRRIPPGQVATYGQVGRLVSAPVGMSLDEFYRRAPRWVGGAMAACPEGVPWQRVINAQGMISLPGASGFEQRRLLETEGIQFDERGRIDLKEYGWTPDQPDQLSLW